ncbi:type 2 periplasmic-binding domain-containing protein [Paenibacillus cymbidii]|uniref:extracellular solute-binding protein n=1 Tax=Paenibacillus cymbidii TaxID=1639034 RepID=UPI0010817414|nr:extracellular solute-binding protein [Paenibacillus cymbidii]
MYKHAAKIGFGSLVLAVLLAGCGGSGTKSAEPSVKPAESANGSAPGTFPITKEKTTMRVFAAQKATIENMETNAFTKMYEDKTNVHIQWELSPENALAEKRKLSLASGDLPDFYLGANIAKDEEILYGSQGIFLPLNDLINKHTKWIKETLESDPIVKQSVTAPDGNIYSLPFAQNTFHATYPSKLWINSKWLKKLNLQMPTTTDELYKVLKAFKENDPNGNGKKDEIPFMAEAITGGYGFIDVLMNSFIGYGGAEPTMRLFIKDGKLDVAYNKPEWKKGLEFLRKLYSEGLLDSTVFSATNAQVKQLAEKADAETIGVFVANWPGVYFNAAGTRVNDYSPVAPLKGPDGVQSAIWTPYISSSGQFVLTKYAKDPVAAIRWADWFYSREGALQARIGREGIEWRAANPGELNAAGKPATWTKLAPINTTQNFFWSQWNTAMNFLIQGEQTAADDIYSPAGLEKRLYQATLLYEPYKPKEVLPTLYIPADETKKIVQSKTDVKSYVDEYIVRFATGEKDLSKDWDAYLKNFDNLGLKEVIAVYQKAYDNFKKNSK